MADTQTRWGILTDGSRWRLLNHDSPTSRYFEVDLHDLAQRDDIEEWLYFYNLFRREAFVPKDGICFLDLVKEESTKYTQEVGEELQDRVYGALRELAQGFVMWPENNLDPSKKEVRDEVRKSCFILLYRLLFVFLGEARGLLPKDADGYRDLSLETIREKTKGASRSDTSFHASSRRLWIALRDLFRLIDQGNQELGIPPYNGGLFSRESGRLTHIDFLQTHDISDKYLARAIDLLGTAPRLEKRDEFVNVDYAGLEIRHLGSIYEVLLEFQLRYAETDKVAVKQKKGEIWIDFDEYDGRMSFKDFPSQRKARKGELFLETVKHERKVTGSYYTPEHIVKYIVRHTLGPIVRERIEKAKRLKRKRSDEILSIKVCDPAMGSGHFLVEATEFLADALLRALEEDLKAELISPGEHSLEWAKREVIRHCIYGVDLNDLAVELSKVSLWLSTVSTDKPLSFLDHRLKCGNSLIGARLSTLKDYPKRSSGKGKKDEDTSLPSFIAEIFIDKLISKVKELEAISDDHLEDIKRKERVFEEFRQLPEYEKTKAIADVHTSIYFGNEVTQTEKKDAKEVYFDLLYSLDYPTNWEPKTKTAWFKRATEIAEEKDFFHWELEFPEVFFEEGRIKTNPGFDAVVGNPPYANIEDLKEDDKAYLKSVHSTIFRKKNDQLYHFLFVNKTLCRAEIGYVGMIISRYFIEAQNADLFRNFLKENYRFIEWNDFGNMELFPGVNTRCVVAFFQVGENKGNIFFSRKIIDWKESHENLFRLFAEQGKKPGFDLEKVLAFEYCQDLLPLDEPWRILPMKLLSIKDGIERVSIPLGGKKGLCNIAMGWNTGLDSAFTLTKEELEEFDIEDDACVPIIKNGEIKQYSLTPSGSVWIDLNGKDIDKYPKALSILEKKRKDLENRYAVKKAGKKWYEFAVVNAVGLFKTKPKIVTPFKAPENRFGVDYLGLIGSQDIYALAIKDEFSYVDPHFVVALLNSRFMTWAYQLFYGRRKKAEFDYYTNLLEHIPIPKIDFTTPMKARVALLENAKELYQEYLKTKARNPILDFLKSRLPKGGNLVREKEESDVVHDLLAYLADQMIEMHRQKQNQTETFFTDLQGVVEEEVFKTLQKGKQGRSLYKKRKCRAYVEKKSFKTYHLDTVLTWSPEAFKDFVKLLAGKVPNLSDIMQVYDKYHADVLKLQERIDKTDELIDQIVYRLYGLTDEEIGIVEGSFGKDDREKKPE
ncbi:MAG: N-6 DNA methylase [Candidatus Thermoplasmatota archaeon]|nr:N-6 DNA methylase [Candidatus Thermoplasmatota archaeon]